MQNKTPDAPGSNPGKYNDVRQGTAVPGSRQDGMGRDNKKAEGMDAERNARSDGSQANPRDDKSTQANPREDRSREGRSDDRSKSGTQDPQNGQRRH